MGCPGPNPIHGGPTSQPIGLKECSANSLVPDTTGHMLKFCEVHALMHQNCFGTTRGLILGILWF